VKLLNINGYSFTQEETLKNSNSKSSSESKIIFNLNNEDLIWVENRLSEMPLFEKCSQIFMPAVFRDALNPSSPDYKKAIELVRDHGIGGVVISQGGVEETALMINELQKNAKIPLLVAADFENGIGMRIAETNTFPQNMAIGASQNSDYAYETGKATAIEAMMLGVNLNFAPVADVNNNPENPIINLRSYSEDIDAVTEFSSAFINGSMDGGVIATAKHFPGHGNTKIDSHKDIPVINGSREYLVENELKPFIELIDNGVQAIMTGHLYVPAFELKNKIPASLSYNIVSGLLKNALGFKGLIITDALDMQAITNYFSPAEAVVKAFKAGNDILLMPPDILIGINAIYDAVKSGEISEERLDESVRKILKAKRWLKLNDKKINDLKNLTERIIVKNHSDLAKEIAEKSVTIVKMEDDLFPLNQKLFSKIILMNISNRNNINDLTFNDFAKDKFSIYNTTTITSLSKPRDYKKAFDAAKESDLILIAGYFTIRQNGNGSIISNIQPELIKKILKLNKKVIILSFENPYILSLFPEAKNYICTFSDTKVSQKAALDILTGLIEPNGRLPVSIPNTIYKTGYRWEKSK
jgi:beta-N-acetylhexosaminidase